MPLSYDNRSTANGNLVRTPIDGSGIIESHTSNKSYDSILDRMIDTSSDLEEIENLLSTLEGILFGRHLSNVGREENSGLANIERESIVAKSKAERIRRELISIVERLDG